MHAHMPEFYRGIAKVVEGENLKAMAYVRHSASLGALREKMVGTFVRAETPGRFRVDTGFVCVPRPGDSPAAVSNQCDLIVHRADVSTPLYRWEDFVVVDAQATEAVVEVKTLINKVELQRISKWHKSIREVRRAASMSLRPYSFAYGIDGINFSTFVTAVAELVKKELIKCQPSGGDALSCIPDSVVVQKKNYFCIKPQSHKVQQRRRLYLVDFTKYDTQMSRKGFSTGNFLVFYRDLLENNFANWDGDSLQEWFNWLPTSDDGKAWVANDGQVEHGKVPAI